MILRLFLLLIVATLTANKGFTQNTERLLASVIIDTSAIRYSTDLQEILQKIDCLSLVDVHRGVAVWGHKIAVQRAGI